MMSTLGLGVVPFSRMLALPLREPTDILEPDDFCLTKASIAPSFAKIDADRS